MFKTIRNIIKLASHQEKQQSSLFSVIGKPKSGYIKTKLPARYLPMLEVIEQYAIINSGHLENIFNDYSHPDRHICSCGSENYGYGFAKCYNCGKIKDTYTIKPPNTKPQTQNTKQ